MSSTVFSFGSLITRHKGPGECPEKGSKAGEGTEVHVLGGAAEELRYVVWRRGCSGEWEFVARWVLDSFPRKQR